MNVKDALEAVHRIRESRGDPEIAHGMEDSLRAAFIAEVAAGHLADAEAKAIAKIILLTDDIDFPRWCA